MLHRTGHSIGLEVHELPSIGAGEKTVIQPGFTCAIEPGIYDFNGVGGYRMEDIVLATETGVEYLSNCRRELTIV
jgi:Xaa-Pro aminopeptidase